MKDDSSSTNDKTTIEQYFERKKQWDTLYNAILGDDDNTIRTILSQDRDLLTFNSYRFPPLMYAVDASRKKAFAALLEFNPDTTQIDLDNTSKAENVLHVSARQNKTAMLIAILNQDKRALNQVDSHGYSPLMEAAHWGNVESAALLIEAGADLTIRDHRHQRTALMIAERNNRPEIVELLTHARTYPAAQQRTSNSVHSPADDTAGTTALTSPEQEDARRNPDSRVSDVASPTVLQQQTSTLERQS